MSASVEGLIRDMLGPPPTHLPPDGERPLVSLELPLGLERMMITRRRLEKFARAAVLVPLLQRESGLQVLLTRRADHLRSHRGQISFPGGRFEPTDGTLSVTALREAEEEVGLPADSVELIGTLDDYPTITKFLVTPVVGIIEQPPKRFTPDAGEVAEVFELPFDYLLEKKNFARKYIIRAGLRLPFYEVEFGKYRVWGATAGMLWNLHLKLRGT